MITDLAELRRSVELPLEYPEAGTLKQQAELALSWLLQYQESLPEQPAGRVGSRKELDALLAGPAPEEGQGFRSAFEEFQQKVLPFGFRLAHPRFLAYIPAAPTFASILGDLLCSGSNFFCGTWLGGSGPATVERVVLDWFRHLLGLPESARGILTSGGSEANLTALLVAREPLAFEDRGRAVVYVSEQRHGSVDRAAKVIG